jgi:hypothetical protein
MFSRFFQFDLDKKIVSIDLFVIDSYYCLKDSAVEVKLLLSSFT